MALTRRASLAPTPKIHSAVYQSLRAVEERVATRPIKDFARALVNHFDFLPTKVELEVASALEPHGKDGTYHLLVVVRPDETDPPFSLSLKVLDRADFVPAPGSPAEVLVTNDALLLEQREIEFLVRPNNPKAAQRLALQMTGETASGQRIDDVKSCPVEVGGTISFQPIPIDKLLGYYEGCDARPVAGRAFVGRQEELDRLQRAVGGPRPSAMILYGARRMGKTSLLDELARRECCTFRPASKTLFLRVGVDGMEDPREGRDFFQSFLELIQQSVLFDSKNEVFGGS